MLDFVWAGSAKSDILPPTRPTIDFRSLTPHFLFQPICRLRGKFGWVPSAVLEKSPVKYNKNGNNISRVAPLCGSARLVTSSYMQLLTSGGMVSAGRAVRSISLMSQSPSIWHIVTAYAKSASWIDAISSGRDSNIPSAKTWNMEQNALALAS